MLGNIDPTYRSNLHVIQLVAAVETQILQKHSIDKILEPFMLEIKALETVSNIFVCIDYSFVINYRAMVFHSLLMANCISKGNTYPRMW